jgi:hypothetical protein
MRLIHSRTLQFHEFYDNAIPKYVILSHTWGEGEISYADMCRLQKLQAYISRVQSTQDAKVSWNIVSGFVTEGEYETTCLLRESRGYTKLTMTAEVASQFGFDYFWMDTCSIDKSSSAELQEAINSMYRWYRESSFCLVHLEDVDMDSIEDLSTQLQDCKWIGRGWTLQELIAPRSCLFLDKNWRPIAYRNSSWMLKALHEATGIPQHVLETCDLSRSSVAQKMSWAAGRITTRAEDRAYSLIGIFGVHMAMLYGEGENAFRRLQEEILRNTPDDSIFAWQAQELDFSICSGLLASSPSEFQHCGNILQGQPIFISTSNLGIRLDIEVSPFDDAGEHDPLYMGWLRSGTLESRCYIILRPLLLEDKYGVRCTRVMTSTPAATPRHPLQVKTVIVRQEPDIPSGLTSALKYCFHVRRSDNYDIPPKYQVLEAWPPAQYHYASRVLSIPRTQERFAGVVFFIALSAPNAEETDQFQLVLGQDRRVPRAWCKFVRQSWPEFYAPESEWKIAIDRAGPFNECGTASVIDIQSTVDPAHAVQLTASMETGLFRKRLALLVSVDGLCWDKTSIEP